MQRYIGPLLWGFGVAVLLGFGMNRLEAAVGEPLGFMTYGIPGFFGVLTMFLLANLAGNKEVAKASASERQAALAFQPPPGQALLVVWREGFVGMAVGLNVMVDGRARAQLKSPRFVVMPLDPGVHEIGAAFGALAAAQSNAANVKLTVAAGEVAVLRATMSLGALKNTVNLELVEDLEHVRRKLANATMVKPDP
jgi:hypothetical protein